MLTLRRILMDYTLIREDWRGSLFLQEGSGIQFNITEVPNEGLLLEIENIGGGGGGTSNHSLLTSLGWSASGHTGTALRLAGFDGGGAASFWTGHDVVDHVLTTRGDMAYRNGVSSTRLPIGAANRLLMSDGTDPAWAAPSDVRTALSLVVGTNVQAWDAGLDSLTAADATAGLPYVGSANSWSTATYTGMLSVVSGAWKVVGLRESGGQDLTMGAVADGAVLRRSGTSIVGAAIGSVLQAWAAILDAIAALSSTGLIVRTGAGTVVARTLTAPAAGITVSNGDGVSGNPTLALADDLAALEGLASTGIAVRTASNTWAQRTVVSADSSVVITNPGGVAGNIDLSVAGGNSDTDPTTGWWVDVQPTAGTVSSRDSAITVRTAAGVSNTADQRRTSFTGSAVANDWYFSANVRPSMSPVFKVRFTTGASIAATTRYKMGLTNTGFTTNDVETSTRYMMLRASTALGDTNWKLVTYDGTTATVTDTGVAFAAATEYNVRMTLTSSSAEVDINGTTTSTSATLPASSSDIGLCMWGLYGSTSARAVYFTGARLSVAAYP